MGYEVVHNVKEERYEILVDGELAGFTAALDRGDTVVFPHTEVFGEFEGQGLASVLVAGALDDVRGRGKRVVATCPYVSRFISKHADYQDLVA